MLNEKQLIACCVCVYALGVCWNPSSQTDTVRRPPCPVWVCVSAECKRPVQFRASPRVVLRELQHMDVLGVVLRRLSTAQCCPVLLAVFLLDPRFISLFLSCKHTHTRHHAHTLKSSLYTVGKTGVSDWMLPAEHFSAALILRNTHLRTHTHLHTHTGWLC